MTVPRNRDYIEILRREYGLDKPMVTRYYLWVKGMVTGRLGVALSVATSPAEPYPVGYTIERVIGGRLLWTIIITILAGTFIWVVALPIGFYSAVRQYSPGDYTATTLGFLGLAIPDFLMALVFMVITFKYFGVVAGGLFSSEFQDAAWSLAKGWNLLTHLWIPIIITGTAGTAAVIRITRANFLDEIRRPYVRTARAKGMGELRLLLKYPFRVSLNPAMSGIGGVLPGLIGGGVIVSVVLNLPTLGPVLLQALLAQDTRTSATIMLLIAMLTVIGVLISDLALAWIDPRIRRGFEG